LSTGTNPNEAGQIARAFDGEAERYHHAYEAPRSAAEMRAVTHRLYGRYLTKGDRILDLNCGPGSDFEFFRKLGVAISGVDLSPEMLKIAQTRAPEAELHCLDYNRIDCLEGEYGAICSNFGGLNTQSEFGDFAAKCRKRLKSGGLLFCNIMTPFSLPEILEGAFRGGHWLRRLRRTPERAVRVGGHPLKVYYFWPRKFYRQFFKAHFSLLEIQGLGVFLPPPYLAPERMRVPKPSLFLEKHLAHRFPFKYWGDHAMLVMRAR